MLEGVEVAELADEGLVHETFGDDGVGERVQDRGIGTRPQRQVILGLDVRHAHEVGAPRVDHYQPGAGA